MNWDVLQGALAQWMLPGTSKRLGEFAHTTPKQISQLLEAYPRQERVRPIERARMLRETAIKLSDLLSNGGALDQILRTPILEGECGLYETMAGVAAYTGDPFDKKARVLAHDLHREGILEFSDPQNLKPAVEYHLIRLYLRSGRVVPTKQSVSEELIGASRPARARLVMLLRGAVDTAMQHTAQYAGIDIATLNYIEWQIGRSICVEELGLDTAAAHCRAPAPETVPGDVRSLADTHCPFVSFCSSLNDPDYGWFREPHFQKAIY